MKKLNDYWWELREKYQGVASPIDRPADAFDPGAKYHIPGNTPYTRYYLARVLQYQFHEALCESMGNEGNLHECSIYANDEAGVRLRNMLSVGRVSLGLMHSRKYWSRTLSGNLTKLLCAT
ncbi:MAG: hypothetical protein Ct9H90mP13_12170 [Pseudomonadota bacterium]|nr:MAG: hypothetical protein Ct9H90mP13_12170 [Pseudomonadota bacterium]